MKPEDPFDIQPPRPRSIPDLPDAALPTIESVDEIPAIPEPNPLLPQNPSESVEEDPDQGRSHLSSTGRKYFKFIEFDDKELLLAEIRKHPFGLFIIIILGVSIAIVVFTGVTGLAASGFLGSLGFGSLNAVMVFAGFLLSILIVAVTFINAHLYRNNVVFVTDEKLAQVLFITLFNRKLSQLSIGDVQDVTVQQNGFIPNLVGYGTLVVETAGEQQNYTFTFVPDPYETSKIIIAAHESSIKLYGN